MQPGAGNPKSKDKEKTKSEIQPGAQKNEENKRH